MTKTCISCKKQPIPFNNTRSFHKFPKCPELKAKWMQITGVTNVSKNAALCSDHFEAHAFHQTDGYTSIRRLIFNAVPTISLSRTAPHTIVVNSGSTSKFESLPPSNNSATDSENVESAQLLCNNKSNLFLDSEDINMSNSSANDSLENKLNMSKTITINKGSCNTSTNESNLSVLSSNSEDNSSNFSFEDCNDMSITSDIDSTLNQPLGEIEKHDISLHNCNSNSENLSNRKRAMNERKGYALRKKFCFKDGSQIHCLSREDFVSDKSWEKFVKYTIYKNSQLAATRQQNWRREKKLGNMKEFINTTKKKQSSVGAAGFPEVF